jgi:elongator complex protein 2
MKPTSELKYIAAACNRYSNVSDCRLSDGLVAYGSGRFIALYHSEVTSAPPRNP